MRPSAWFLLALSLASVALAAPATAAGARQRAPIRVLSPDEVDRLEAPTQRIARAVAEYRSAPPDVSRYVPVARGTAFLVHASKRELVWLTNHHVLSSIESAQFATRGLGFVVTDDGAALPVIAALAASETLDYAIVVTAASGRGRRTPIPLQPEGVAPGAEVYVLSGYNSLAGLLDTGVLRRALGLPRTESAVALGGADSQDYFDRYAQNKRNQQMRTIVAGTYRGSYSFRSRQGHRTSERFDCRVAQGTSGSPILSATSNRAVALLWGMDPSSGQTALATSLRRVLDDLARKVDRGEVPPAYRALVRAFLRRAG